MTEVKQWFTTEEAAKIMRVNVATIRRMLRQGKVPGTVKVGRAWRLPVSWVLPRDPLQ